MKVSKRIISWQNQRLSTTEFKPSTVQRDVLILHGAGEADQTRVTALAKALSEHDCRVVTFDFVGHGHSTGKITDLNLEKRARQAKMIIDSYELNKELILIGCSMSGQTALDLLDLTEVTSLIMLVPAVYTKHARKAYFGSNSEFTKLIRQKDSWRQSDAWSKISSFHGQLLIVTAEHDSVIPRDIPDQLFDSALHTSKRTLVEILNAPHALGAWMSERAERAEWFAQAITCFISGQNFEHFLQQNRSLSARVLKAKQKI